MNDKRTPPLNPNAVKFKYDQREHQEVMHESNRLMWKQHIKGLKNESNN